VLAAPPVLAAARAPLRVVPVVPVAVAVPVAPPVARAVAVLGRLAPRAASPVRLLRLEGVRAPLGALRERLHRRRLALDAPLLYRAPLGLEGGRAR